MWAFERGELWGITLNDLPLRVEPRLPVKFQEATLEFAPALTAAMGMNDASQVRERLTTGRRCMVALLESSADNTNEIAAYGWISVQPEYIGEQEREIKLQANEAYIWDCATLPKFRGQRLYSALLSQTLVALAEQSVRRVWIGSSLDNQSSLRGFANAGFQAAITLTYARLWRLHCLWIETPRGAPRELTEAARRELVAPDEHAWLSLAWGWSPFRYDKTSAGMEAHS